MDSKKEICLSSENKSNERPFKRLDFGGLIIEVRESNVKKITPDNDKQCDENDPPNVNGADMILKQENPEPPPKPQHLKSAPVERGASSDTEPTTPQNENNECLGAAGLWFQTEKQSKSCTELEETEILPPPVTEEDLAIIRQFMEAEPENNLSSKSRLKINQEEFVCSICESFILKNEGAVLNCLHNFCRGCLIQEINENHDELGQVKCPFPFEKCESYIVVEEVEDLLGDDYDKFLFRIVQMQDASEREKIRNDEASKHDTLPALLETDNHEFIENFERFECSVCLTDIEIGAGLILKNCLHKFCKDCIIESVKYSEEFIVKCPYIDDTGSCQFTIQEREIRGLVPDDIFDKLLEKSLKLYEGVSSNVYHCKTPDCKGLIETDENFFLPHFICEVCSKKNCLQCEAIHEGKECWQYKQDVNPSSAKQRREEKDSEQAIENLISTGQAMKCPRCGISVEKVAGCDFLTCSTCRLGICWRTKKPRLPFTKENGTIIDGCHCRENGGLCHPQCQNCH